MSIPQEIEELAHKVRNEIYGRDVREAIASSMEATAEVAEWSREVAQQLIDGSFDEGALNTAIEQKLNDLEQEYAPQLSTIKNEVEDARGSDQTLGDRLDGVSAQLAQTRDDLEYKINEDVQNLESNINQELNNVVKHRPIHVGNTSPSNEVGENGDVYLQLYSEEEPLYYEEGTFVPSLYESPGIDFEVSYSRQEGVYTRVGNLVHVVINLEFSDFSTTTEQIGVSIDGLPYKAAITTSTSIPPVTNLTPTENFTLNRGLIVAGYNRMSIQEYNHDTGERRQIRLLSLAHNTTFNLEITYRANVGDF